MTTPRLAGAILAGLLVIAFALAVFVELGIDTHDGRTIGVILLAIAAALAVWPERNPHP